MTAAAEASIYESIGGEPALVAVVDDFYVRVLADPQLAGFFAGANTTKSPNAGSARTSTARLSDGSIMRARGADGSAAGLIRNASSKVSASSGRGTRRSYLPVSGIGGPDGIMVASSGHRELASSCRLMAARLARGPSGVWKYGCAPNPNGIVEFPELVIPARKRSPLPTS